ncbi:MAG: response regulator transcription factor [Verrucomicrobia bacterium]|nr:response regulator transcription factor [Verrucomicrobiota bacterium]
MRILIAEDDRKLAEFMVNGLRENSFSVDHAADGSEALALALKSSYDTAVIDVMLPSLDGLDLIRQLRREKADTPVLVLSALASVDDRVRGLNAGADDYLTKPFSFSELLARVHALIRRATRTSEPSRLSAGDLVIDLLAREVTRGGQKVDLAGREFALLEYLVRHAGRPVTKTMLLEHVWDYSFDPQTNVVDVVVCRLRQKLERDLPGPRLIHTLRGVGYVFRSA